MAVYDARPHHRSRCVAFPAFFSTVMVSGAAAWNEPRTPACACPTTVGAEWKIMAVCAADIDLVVKTA